MNCIDGLLDLNNISRKVCSDREYVTLSDRHISVRGSWGTLSITADLTYQIDAFSEGIVIHDGRIAAWEDDPKDWNGSFLAFKFPGRKMGQAFQFISDKLGTILLYWTVNDSKVLFSSRLEYFAKYGIKDLDCIAAWQMLLFNTPLWERSLLKGVNLQLPGSRVKFRQDKQPSSDTYWSPSINENEPTEKIDYYSDRLVEKFHKAHERALKNAEGPLLFPVTGGLDSRINLAIHRKRWSDLNLFHCYAKGNIEGAIANEIAQIVSRPLELIPEEDAIRAVLEANPWEETGELNLAQWWLRGTYATLSRMIPGGTLLDGYMQDVLFKASLIEEANHIDDTVTMRTGIHRLKHLDVPLRNSTIQQVFRELREKYPSGAPISASQLFYLANRSRRFVFGTVRIAGNYMKVKTPGLDNELLQFGFSIPWTLRRGAVLYKNSICRVAPDLAAIRYDKTGLPLTMLKPHTRWMKLKKKLSENIAWHWPNCPFLSRSDVDLARLMMTDSSFSDGIRNVLYKSLWVRSLLSESQNSNRTIDKLTGEVKASELTYALLTIAHLENSIAKC